MAGLTRSIKKNLSLSATQLFLKRLNKWYTNKFIILCWSVYLGGKGAAYNFIQQVETPYYRDANIPGDTMQVNSAIARTPWAIKAIIGVISDTLPFFGYQKKYYMILIGLLGTSCSLALAILPLSFAAENTWIPALGWLFVNFQISSFDLFCEGKYVEFMHIYPESRGDIVTFVWMLTTLGGLLPSIVVGIFVTYLPANLIFYVVAILCFQTLPFIFMGYMVNDAVSPEKNNRLDYEKIARQWKVILLALFMATGAIGSSLFGLFGNSFSQFAYSFTAAIVLGGLAYWSLPWLIAQANCYMLILSVSYINLTGALDYFYLGDEVCVPNGPHFSELYYRTYTTVAATIAGMVGIYLYQILIADMTYRSAFWITILLRVFASLFDLILVLRWNIRIGIPDHLMYLCGSAIIYNVAYMMDYIPSSVLISKLCPKHIEMTVFALLAGYFNYGETVGRYIGVYMMNWLEIQTLPTELAPCNFNNLYLLVIFGHILFPLIPIPFTFILLPSKYIREELLEEVEINIPKMKIANLKPQHSYDISVSNL